MSDSSRRRTTIIVVLILLALLALLLGRCKRNVPEVDKEITTTPATVVPVSAPATSTPTVAAQEKEEVLTPATIEVPSQVIAGAAFPVKWTGPNNKNDFVTIVSKDAAEGAYTNYRETHDGATLDLTATIEPGEFEVRYVAAHSKKVLGRAAITVVPAPATLSTPAEVVLGSLVAVEWTGPNNKDDYVTIVAKETLDGKYDNFAYTTRGSPVPVNAPVIAGDAEVRYVSGQGAKVLARRAIKIKYPDVTISAPDQCIAGSSVTVAWSGPNNAGDYITIVSKETRDGLYGNYAYTNAGASLKILAPIESGEAELRYMTGQGAKVLGRKTIAIVAPHVTLSAPEKVNIGVEFKVVWEGPNNSGDYITIVPKNTKDGQYANYTYTNKGSPLTLMPPKEAGEGELRYMTGQGGKVLARRSITLSAP
jgi:CxxC motif-containing protein